MPTDDAGRDDPQPAGGGGTRPSESWWSPPEPGSEPAVGPADEAAGGVATDADTAGAEADAGAAGGYAPPRSPAYDAHRRRGPHFVRSRTPGAAPAADVDEHLDGTGVPVTAARPGARGASQLLITGLVLALVAVVVAVLLNPVEDPASEPHEFGSVRTTAPGATVRTDGSERPLAEGDVLTAGDMVQVPPDGSIALDLVAGGVARADEGAGLAFVDDAAGTETDEGAGPASPVIEITTGRAWVNPADGVELVVRVPAASVTTLGNPVAVRCDEQCSVEAPAAGARIDGDAGGSARPAAGEVITVDADGALALADGTEITDFAQANLDDDSAEEIPEPEPGDSPGVRASATVDGTYPLQIEIVGDPEGDALPPGVVYSSGETYDVQLAVAGSGCTTAPCRAPVQAGDGSSGSADVGDGVVSLSFANPFDCLDESRTTVIESDIGTTTVEGELTVDRVVERDGRWHVASFAGPGSVSTRLTAACNAGDVLGTSTSAARITGG
jgi:hypothetical protein